MDLLPTFVRLAGTEPPKDRIIDGKNIWHLLAPASSPLPPGGKKGGAGGAESPYEVFYYYMVDQLQAVRSDKWKLYLPLKKLRGKRASRPMKLVDLSRDIGETTDLSQQHPEVVEKLLALAEKAREDLGDLGRKGRGQRPAGFVQHPTPRLLKR